MLAHEAEVYLASIRAEARARNSDVLIGLLRYDFETRRDQEWPARDECRGRRVVLQAPPGAIRRILSGAGLRAPLDAPDEPALLRHDAGSRAPGAAARRRGRSWARRSATRTPMAPSSWPCSARRRCWSMSPTTPGSATRRRRTSSCRWRASARARPGASLVRATSNGITAVIAAGRADLAARAAIRAGGAEGQRAADDRAHALRAHRQLAGAARLPADGGDMYRCILAG